MPKYKVTCINQKLWRGYAKLSESWTKRAQVMGRAAGLAPRKPDGMIIRGSLTLSKAPNVFDSVDISSVVGITDQWGTVMVVEDALPLQIHYEPKPIRKK